ncbi:MAG: hypothetical protein U1A78_04570 [Polyangia bacterium]
MRDGTDPLCERDGTDPGKTSGQGGQPGQTGQELAALLKLTSDCVLISHDPQVQGITARKRLEAALRDSEVRFRSLMEQAPFCIRIFAPDGRPASTATWSSPWTSAR